MLLPIGFLCSEGSFSLFYVKKLESNDLINKKAKDSVHLDFMSHIAKLCLSAVSVTMSRMYMSFPHPLPMFS